MFITLEDKIANLRLGLKLEKKKITELQAQLEISELCEQVEINKKISVCERLIKNISEKIDVLENLN